MTSFAKTTARSITCTLNVRIAWWLMPYLRALAFICALTGMEPNLARVRRLIDKGVTVTAKPVTGRWRYGMREVARIGCVTTFGLLSASAAVAYPAHAWPLGLLAGLMWAWLTQSSSGASLKMRQD